MQCVESSCEHSLTVCENTLFHWEALFVIATGNAQNETFPFITQQIGWNFSAHTLLVEDAKFVFIHNFKELLSSGSWIRNVQLIDAEPKTDEKTKKNYY